LGKEVKQGMKRSHLFGTILALVLVVSVAVATIVPALAHNNRDDDEPKTPPVPGTLKSYGYGGYVLLQLPSPSMPSHPYNMRLSITHFDERSANGKEDYISIYVWSTAYPGGSRFVWIGGISDVQAGIDFVKAMYTGFVGAAYHIKVEDSELEITKKDDVLTVNLTKSVAFNIGDPWAQHYKDLNFTFPPMTLTFRGFDEVYKEEGAPTKLAPPASGAGWTIQNTQWRKPAWIEVSIPAWYGSTVLHTEGYINTKFVMTITPPPAP
jgi:hypothetical protein